MPEAFLRLETNDRRDALEIAAAGSGRPVHLLEKDVWVVWALDVMFSATFGKHLVFKGGTSLSKAYEAIRRFSEDVDEEDQRAPRGVGRRHGPGDRPGRDRRSARAGHR
jgi:hypothetical protein